MILRLFCETKILIIDTKILFQIKILETETQTFLENNTDTLKKWKLFNTSFRDQSFQMTGIVSIPRGLETRCHILLKHQCISTLVALVNWWHYSTKSRRAPRPPMPRLGCRLMQRLARLCTKLDQVAPPRSDLTSYNRYLCQVARPKWTLQNWQKDFFLL